MTSKENEINLRMIIVINGIYANGLLTLKNSGFQWVWEWSAVLVYVWFHTQIIISKQTALPGYQP